MLAGISTAYSVAYLGYRTSRADLVNPASQYHRLWAEYAAEFGERDDAIIVVEGNGPQQITPVIDELGVMLSREEPLLHSVLEKVDLTRLKSKGLYFVPLSELRSIDQYLAAMTPVLHDDWSQLSVGGVFGTVLAQVSSAAQPYLQQQQQLLQQQQLQQQQLQQQQQRTVPQPGKPAARSQPPGRNPSAPRQAPAQQRVTQRPVQPPPAAKAAQRITDTQRPQPNSQAHTVQRVPQPPSSAPPAATRTNVPATPATAAPAGSPSVPPPDPAQLTAMLAPLERFCSSLGNTLSGGSFRSPWPDPPVDMAGASRLGVQYPLSSDGRFGFIMLRLEPGDDTFNPGGKAAARLRELVVQARTKFKDVKIGLTGLPIMEDDEMTESQSSMFWASLISMIGVGILFVAGFGGIRHALLANTILLIGMAWSFAYATATVGHLNILSVTFTATLIGIGIDYGVYYCARYIQLRKEVGDIHTAILETSRSAGPAITTGAISTAVSFFAAGCTSFVGVAELGIIAGGGILLCAVAELTLLPATLLLVDRSRWGRKMPVPLAVHKWVDPFLKKPRLTLAVAIVATVIMALGLGKLWYDNNLLNMQAVGLESVELERRLLNEANQSAWYALSIADTPQQLLERKAAMEKLPSVERTEEIVSLLPGDAAAKQPLIHDMAERLAPLPGHVPLIPVERPELIIQQIGQLQQMLAVVAPQAPFARQLGQLRGALEKLPSADAYTLLSRFQQQGAEELLARLRLLKVVAGPEPPQWSDLPPSLVERFVGMTGKHLLRIYGRGNTWDSHALAAFVDEVRSVDPHVTGNPLQAHEASLDMQRSFQQAAMYSMAIIIVVLWLDFRNWQYPLLAALPLGVGVLESFGLMGWLNIPLNPANMIALPLILGIGIDYGVHIVHEFREQKGPYRMSPGTAVAVLVDVLTTIVGYGSLMIASHQGLCSLGRVLTLGVTCCLFSSLIMLPALLTWVTRKRPAVGDPAAMAGSHSSGGAPTSELELAPEPAV